MNRDFIFHPNVQDHYPTVDKSTKIYWGKKLKHFTVSFEWVNIFVLQASKAGNYKIQPTLFEESKENSWKVSFEALEFVNKFKKMMTSLNLTLKIYFTKSTCSVAMM